MKDYLGKGYKVGPPIGKEHLPLVKKLHHLTQESWYRKIQELTAFKTPTKNLGHLEGWHYCVETDKEPLKLQKLPYDQWVDVSTRVWD